MAKKPIEKARESLKKAFGIAAIAGVLIILAFLNSENDKFSYWLLIIPMVAYIIYGNQLAKKYQYLPDFADSVYYLGFSFTLLSLFGATILEKLSAEPEDTISYFGMALSTTILGILYRTYHSQFTDLNQDPIEKAKEELDEELANFRDELDSLFERTSDALNLLESDLPEKLSSSITNIEEKLIYSFLQVEEDLKSISNNYAKINFEIADAYKVLNNNIKSSSENISNNFNDISSNMNVRSQEINRSMDEFATQMSTFQEQTKNYGEEIIGEGEMNGSFRELTNSLKTYLSSMNSLTQEVEDASSGFSTTLDTLKSTSATIAKQATQIKKIFKQANEVLENRLN